MRSSAGTALSATFLIATAWAAMNFNSLSAVLRADDVQERPFLDVLNTAAKPLLVRRRRSGVNADKGNPETIKGSSDGKFNMTAWSTETNDACVAVLKKLPRSTNPSGNCVCYNLPTLDAVSGVFEAELRLYRVSEPRDAFANISRKNTTVGVSYQGASVSPVSSSEVMGKGKVNNETRIVTPREIAGGPSLIQTYLFVGQIDKAKMAENMSIAALQAVVIPTFTLTGTNSSGGSVQATISMNEALFLRGVFSKSVVMSDFSAAQAAVTTQLNLLHNGTIAFILPGTQIMIFPIGAIITAAWLVLGLVAYGWGTYERMSYAEDYKRKQARMRAASTI
ncbi:uncharacterized protein MAM_03075 [Metarhizium album ARSEF 1941]|uniref:Uncharacterized protein n=1 Tax=Metarhizium album (strain ARSEF 1941) TaxID=1081103 RepID=A0A0B2X139_METAS|nr:uncharacterized protein MAM_03075 [Metarhizium album ARSEF 1941]KHN99377.1 hypothetical protein MAM_03075 [Metarhizium album ARSEF 1941]